MTKKDTLYAYELLRLAANYALDERLQLLALDELEKLVSRHPEIPEESGPQPLRISPGDEHSLSIISGYLRRIVNDNSSPKDVQWRAHEIYALVCSALSLQVGAWHAYAEMPVQIPNFTLLLKDIPEGDWVGFSGDGTMVLAHGPNLEEVAKQAPNSVLVRKNSSPMLLQHSA